MDDINKEDRLKNIFDNMSMETPSMAFEKRLMQHIYLEHKLIEKKKKRFSLLYMVLGVLAVAVLPIIVLRIIGWSIVEPSKLLGEGMLQCLTADPLIMSISIVCLILLIMDTFIRKYIREKKDKHDLN